MPAPKIISITSGESVSKYGKKGPVLFCLLENGDLWLRDEITDTWDPVDQKQLDTFYSRIEKGTSARNPQPRKKYNVAPQ